MNEAEEAIILGLIESKSRAIAALAGKVEDDRLMIIKRIESNSKAIAALANRVEEDRKMTQEVIQSSPEAVTAMSDSLTQMQGRQISLTQLVSDQHDILKDFREIITDVVKRMEKNQTQTYKHIETLQKNVLTLAQKFAQEKLPFNKYTGLDEVQIRHSLSLFVN